MKIDLAEKIILVTGASRGIGKAIATLAAEAGATLAVHANSSMVEAQALCKELGKNSKAFQADLKDMEAVQELYRSVIAEFGQLDVLVNNAGIAISSPLELDNPQWLEDWNTTLAVNLTASGLLC